MPDKDPATAAAEAAAKKLVEVAYGDLLQAASHEVGAELHEFVKTIIVAGRGFGYLIRETYEPLVVDALSRIPLSRRIVPRPQLLGPILEGVTHQQPETEIYVMFQSLLSCAMDRERAHLAHPAFPDLVKSLSPDEARLLRRLYKSPITTYYNWPTPEDTELVPIRDFQEIEVPDDSGFYLEHLKSLSLVNQYADKNEDNAVLIDGLWSTPIEFRISSVGHRLMRACLHQD